MRGGAGERERKRYSWLSVEALLALFVSLLCCYISAERERRWPLSRYAATRACRRRYFRQSRHPPFIIDASRRTL